MTKIFLEGFERGVLFRLARFVAMSAIMLLFGLIIAGSVFVVRDFNMGRSEVSPENIVASLKPISQGNHDDTNTNGQISKSGLRETAESTVKIPFVVQKYMDSVENIAVLNSWLSVLNDSEKKVFLSQLAQTVDAAEKSEVDPMAAINKFKEVKFSRLEEERRQETERNTHLIWFAGLIATSLILTALLSLTLVLLAVERNTRIGTTL
jgi:hypothetical protein